MPIYTPTEADTKAANTPTEGVDDIVKSSTIATGDIVAPITPSITKDNLNSPFYTDGLKAIKADEQRRRAEYSRRIAVEGASLTDKLSAAGEAFSDNNLMRVVDWVKIDMAAGDIDEEFSASLDEAFINEVMSVNGLKSPKTYNLLIEAKNQEHFNERLTLAVEREKREEEIANTLTTMERTGATIAGDLLTDPTLLMTGGIGLSAKFARIKNIVSTNRNIAISTVAASEIGYGAATAAANDDFDGVDAFLFYALPAAFDGMLIAKSMRRSVDMMGSKDKLPDIRAVDDTLTAGGLKAADDLINELKAGGKGAAANETLLLDSKKALEERIAKLTEELDSIPKYGGKGRNPRTGNPGKNPDWLRKNKELQAARKELEGVTGKIQKFDKLRAVKATIKGSKAYKQAMSRKALLSKVETITKELERRKVAPYYKKAPEAGRKLLVEDAAELAKDIERTLKTVKGMKLDDVTRSKTIDSLAAFMHETGIISKTAYKKAIKSKSLPDMRIKPSGNGKTAEVIINGRKVNKIPIAAAIAIGGATGLMADDGEWNDVFNSIPVVMAAVVIGLIFGKGALTKLKGIKLASLVKEGVNTGDKARAMEASIPTRIKIDKAMNRVRTQFTETVEPVKRATSGALKAFADLLYYDPINNTGGSIERAKAIFVRRYFNSYLKDTNDLFFKWLEATGKTKMDYVSSIFTGESLKVKFKTMVTKYRTEGLYADVKEVVEASKIIDDYFESMAREFIENGVKGADKLKGGGIKNYVPRLMRVEELRAIMAYADRESRVKLIENFAEMITANYSYEKKIDIASAYLEHMLDSTYAMNMSKRDKTSILKGLIDRGIPEDVADDIVSSMMSEASRLQFRLGLDYKKFKPIKIYNVDGTHRELRIDDVFEHNMDNIMSRYINMMGGHNALAVHGFKSLDEALQLVVHGAGEQWAKNVIMQDLLAVAGHPAVDYSNVANVAARGAANIAIGTKMILSTISMMSELFIYSSYVMRRNGVFKGMSKIANDLLDNFGKDAFVSKSAAFGKDGMGIGTHRYTGSFGQLKKYDEVGNIDTQIGNKLLKGTEILRDFTLFTLPFVKTSDFLQRLNLQDVLDTLYHHLKSDKKVINAYELDALPSISQELKSYLKNTMTLNDKAHVKHFDIASMPLSLQNEFRELVDAMMLKRMNEATMGTSAPFSRHTALGIAMMPMLKYGMTAFSNLGIYDMRGAVRGDFHALTRTMLWFQAGMLQTHIRYAIEGKEQPDDETLLINGFMNMPIMGAYSLFTSLGDSPTEQVIRDITTTVDLYDMTR